MQSGFVEISSPPGAPPKRYLPAPFAGGTYFGGTLLQFSPDGSKIFFAIRHPKGPPEYWLLPWPNEGGKEAPVRIFKSVDGLINSFTWWPDSRRAIVSLAGGFYDGHLWLVDMRQGLVHAITTGLGAEAHADVSADGTKIAFTDVMEDFDVMDVPFNEDPPRKVVATTRREASPVWAPGGKQFAYLTDRSGSYEIWSKGTQEGWERPIVRKEDFKDGSRE